MTIEEYEIALQKANDRNEYNENLYKQQYLSLKRGLVSKLKQDLQLELDGLKDIADTLNDTQRAKIQRRIDRIYKIILNIGE